MSKIIGPATALSVTDSVAFFPYDGTSLPPSRIISDNYYDDLSSITSSESIIFSPEHPLRCIYEIFPGSILVPKENNYAFDVVSCERKLIFLFEHKFVYDSILKHIKESPNSKHMNQDIDRLKRLHPQVKSILEVCKKRYIVHFLVITVSCYNIYT